MSNLTDQNEWVWIIVQDPGTNEKIVGQVEQATNISYIPTFQSKEDALKCFNHFTSGHNAKFEVQAILHEDLSTHARENGFNLFFINGSGEIVEQIVP